MYRPGGPSCSSSTTRQPQGSVATYAPGGVTPHNLEAVDYLTVQVLSWPPSMVMADLLPSDGMSNSGPITGRSWAALTWSLPNLACHASTTRLVRLSSDGPSSNHSSQFSLRPEISATRCRTSPGTVLEHADGEGAVRHPLSHPSLHHGQSRPDQFPTVFGNPSLQIRMAEARPIPGRGSWGSRRTGTVRRAISSETLALLPVATQAAVTGKFAPWSDV